MLRNCDIVMKGGITSGIVYPPAVLEIAQDFRFNNIGGTSAGAIAAALTAAAEYRRLSGGGLAGFERLARVPEELAQNHRLLNLFAADESTRTMFDRVKRIIAAPSKQRLRTALGILWGRLDGKFWFDFIVGALLGIVLAVLSVVFAGANGWPGTVAGVLLALAGGAAYGLSHNVPRLLLDDLERVRANGYGFSRGVGSDPADDSLLSIWLAKLLSEIAGLTADEPLTFGHLWFGRPPAPGDSPTRPQTPQINLEMVTTCITHGRPYTFPAQDNHFYYDPEQLAHYVAPSVLDWMNARPRQASSPESLTAAELANYRRLPVDRDLPVVLVTRMSLAFPLLLAAVPLAAVNDDERTRAPGTDPHAPAPRPLPTPCWFADGGISSNFPIHLFDAPLPRWPTFGINLGTFGNAHAYDAADQSKNVWMAERNGDERFEQWATLGGWGSYASAMLGAIKDWNDNLQMRMPGFRDRIVTIGMRDEEGGLNLDMGDALIRPLIERGRAAGKLLVERFAAPSTGAFVEKMDWENHRVVRYRVAMSTLQRYFASFRRGFESPQPDDESYANMLAEARTKPFPAYKWLTNETRDAAGPQTQALADLPKDWADKQIDFEAGAPRPAPDLVKRPRG